MKYIYVILLVFLPVLANAGDFYHKIKCKNNSCWISTYEKKLLLDKKLHLTALEKKGGAYVGFAHSQSWYADLYFYPKKELLITVSDDGRRSYWTCRKINENEYYCE